MPRFKRYRSHNRRFSRLLRSRRTWVAVAFVAVVFGFANAAVFAAHLNRTYSNTIIGGKQLGAVPSDELSKKLAQQSLLPQGVQFKHDSTTANSTIDQLGISIDYDELADKAMAERSWLPIANLWTKHTVRLALSSDSAKLDKTLGTALDIFNKAATDAHIEAKDGNFVISPDANQQTVNQTATKQQLLDSLARGESTVAVIITSTAAKVASKDLEQELQKFTKQSKTAITLTYNGQSKRLTAAQVTSFYTPEGTSMALSDSAILTTVAAEGSAWNIVVQNRSAAIAMIRSAVQNQKDTSVPLEAAPVAAKTITYCSATRGVSNTELTALNIKLESTYNDSRGWSLGGLVRFVRSDANCQLHVWLTAADQMSSFGEICDSLWSCNVYPNVVINYDRWRYASEAWNAQKGTLEDYRAMVINHESGHWLGFYHSSCPGPGQPAPLMQQQSIDLQGCTFNPWPTATEQAALKQTLGI